MSEFLRKPNPEQLMLGGLLALIEDYSLEFDAGYFEDDDIDDMVGSVMGALNDIYKDGYGLLLDYGVIEENIEEEEDDYEI